MVKVNRIKTTSLCIAAIALGFALWFAMRPSESSPEVRHGDERLQRQAAKPAAQNARQSRKDKVRTEAEDESRTEIPQPEAAEEPEAPQTEQERREAEEEAHVEEFDAMTDKWMEANEVTMKSVGEFVSAFKRIPKERQDECIHRALNLVPDENVMLLAGVLMDKSVDREIVETVFNDILNRDEDVKKPILKTVFQDKTHPCWADTAWILDVTGETPDKSK